MGWLVISEEVARAKILESVEVLPSGSVSLAEARACFARGELRARLALPPFDNSAMDGYAVRAADATEGARLRVIGEQAAGVDERLSLDDGEAIRIFTGAPLPAGADAVVMQEETERDGDEILIRARAEAGEFVRRRGGDVTEGQAIVRAGQRLRSETLALLAAQGFGEVEVGGAASVALFSTGDELVPPGGNLQPGQIYESNSTLLRGLIEGAGATVSLCEHVADDPAKVRAAFERGLRQDALVISGGVSVGDRDFVQPVLRELGVEIDFWRVAMKPGKPFLFGRASRCAVFALPGNPVSSFVTFLALVRPALLKMMGASEEELPLPTSLARLADDVKNDGDRVHYLRGRLQDQLFAPIGPQESHALFGLSRANGLLRLAPKEKRRKGDLVSVSIWSHGK